METPNAGAAGTAGASAPATATAPAAQGPGMPARSAGAAGKNNGMPETSGGQAPPPATEQPKEPERRKYNLGKRGEVELTDAEIQRKLQSSYGIEDRLREAQQKEARANQMEEAIRSKGVRGFLDLAKEFGINDVDSQMQEYLLEQQMRTHDWDEQQKQWRERDPQERELIELRERAQRYEQAEKQRQEQARQAQLQQQQEAYTQQLIKSMRPILDGLGYSEETSEFLLPHIAEEMLAADEVGIELTPEMAIMGARERIGGFVNNHLTSMPVGDLKRTIQSAFAGRLADLPPAELESMLGENVIKNLLRYTLTKLPGGSAPSPQQPSSAQPSRKESPMERRQREQEALNVRVFGQVRR